MIGELLVRGLVSLMFFWLGFVGGCWWSMRGGPLPAPVSRACHRLGGAYAILLFRWRSWRWQHSPFQVGAWVHVKHSPAKRLARIVKVDPPSLTGEAWFSVVFIDPPVEKTWCWLQQLKPATPTEDQVAAWLIYELEGE